VKYLTLVPAYGRDYKSQKEVKAALDAGKDFKIADMSSPDDGRMVGKEELLGLAPIQVNIRYKNLGSICAVRFE
jgi:hypothetical protein